MNGIVVETGMRSGTLEVECIIRRKDGTIKEVERATRPVSFKLDQTGEQVIEIQEEETHGLHPQ